MNDTNKTIKDEVLERITAGNLKPTSKWYFTVRHAALWTPGILVTVLGSFAVAGMLFSAVHAGWEYRSFTRFTLVEFLREVVPLVWIGSFALFGTLIVRSLRLTSRGYRYKTGLIMGTSFAASVILGSALFALDMTVKQNALIRFTTERSQRIIWTSPLEGRLAGVVDTDDGFIVLTDTTGKQWVLDTSELLDGVLLTEGASVRIVGETLGDESFLTCVVVPWDLTPIKRSPGFSRTAMRTPPSQIQNISPRCVKILDRNHAVPNERNLVPAS